MNLLKDVSSRPGILLGLELYRYFPALAMLGLACVIAWAGTAGVFTPISGWVYDQSVRWAPRQAVPESPVLIVEINRSPVDPDVLRKAVQEFQRLGADIVAFNFLPTAPVIPPPLAGPGPTLIFGARLVRDPVTGVGIGVEGSPQWLVKGGAEIAVSAMPVAELGISRRGRTRFPAGDDGLQTIEAAVVAARGDGTGPPPRDSFLVNFLDGDNRIPAVTLERVIGQGLVRPMVAGKVVLVGFAQDIREPGLHTPVSGPERTTSLLRFQAQGIDTLLRNAAIAETGFVGRLIILVVLIGVALYLYQSVKGHIALALTALFIVLYFLLALPILAYGHVSVPVTQMVLVQAIVFIIVFVQKLARQEAVLHRALIETSSKIRQRIIPASFYGTEDPWIYVADLLSQTLDLNRMIFLEKVEGDHRVKEVHALNCSLEDIDERRRDYQRTPYSTAIAAQTTIRLEKAYLNDDGSGADQYLACLSFAGEIIGFWAFCVLPEKVSDEAHFIALVRDYSEQVAEMLYHRQRWMEAQRAKEMPLLRFLRLEGWEEMHRAFQHSLALHDKRLTTLEQVFDGIGTAAVLYDLFGRVVHVNKRMEQLFKQAKLPFFSLTSVELIAAITGKDHGTIRQYLQYVVIEQTVIAMPTPLFDDNLHAYLLILRPLKRERAPADDGMSADAMPFHLGGVLIEAQDITMFRTLNELQENLVERLSLRMRNDLEALLLGVDLIDESPGSSASWLKPLLKEKVDSTVTSFEEVQRHLDFTVDITDIECFPIDYKPLLEGAVRELETEAGRRNVRMSVNQMRLTPLVIAGPDALREVFYSLLAILTEDAMEGTAITVLVSTEKHAVRFLMENRGFGLPADRLHAYLYGDTSSSIDEFRRARAAVRWVAGWGGELRAEAEVGKGIGFDLTLRGFM